jgi:hypothetical protein
MNKLHQPETIDQIPTIDLREFDQSSATFDNENTESWMRRLSRSRAAATLVVATAIPGAVAGLAHAQERGGNNTTPTSGTNTEQQIPTVMQVVEPQWQQDIAQVPYPGWELIEPKTIADLQYNIDTEAFATARDPIAKIRIVPVKNSTNFKVYITQENKRVEVTTAQFHDPNNTSDSERLGASVDADLYSQKTISAQEYEINNKPSIRTTQKPQGHPAGKLVKLKDWDNFNSANMSRPMKNGYDTQDPLHTGKVEIKTNKHISFRELSKMILKEEVFIHLNQTSYFRLPEYQAASAGQIDCATSAGESYKVLSIKKPTTYRTHAYYKQGNILTDCID